MHDAYTGLVEDSLTVTADFPLDNVQAGEDLANRFTNTSPGIWEMKLPRPLRKLDKGPLARFPLKTAKETSLKSRAPFQSGR